MGETMDQTPIHTYSTSNVSTEDTISLNSYKNYSQSESTLNCSSVKQKYTSEEFFVESYFKSEKNIATFHTKCEFNISCNFRARKD